MRKQDARELVLLMLSAAVMLVTFTAGCEFNFYDSGGSAIKPAETQTETWKHRKYGLLPDKPDKTEKLWSLPSGAKTVIPAKTDFSALFPAVYDQGELGSCTANGLLAAVDYIRKLQGLSYVYPSRLFLYYNERDIEGTVDEDAGARIQDGVKSLMRQGVCHETTWQYNVAKFKVKPPAKAYQEAMEHQALEYAKIPDSGNLLIIRQTLANHFPIVFGFMVYESFETEAVARSGICPMPKPREQCLGGHCVVMVGYDDNFSNPDGSKGAALVRNSWGPQWGLKGYFWMPYKFLQKYASDFWVIKRVE